MRCANPYTGSGGMFGCGQCLPCRFNRRRTWQHRLILEATQHSHQTFVTLTYDDEHVPEGHTLVPKHLQDFLKRLRHKQQIRYFAVGEYGETTQRPHYHLALFGYPNCNWLQSRYAHRKRCCVACDTIRDTWGRGNVFLGTLSSDSASYVAGYVCKKMTNKDDPRLAGRHPEFSRMSLKPGIGFHALAKIADAIRLNKIDTLLGDVPASLRHGSRIMPLGRYLRSQLRLAVMGQKNASPEAQIKAGEALHTLRILAKALNYEKEVHELIKEEIGNTAANAAMKHKLTNRRSL
ncbi:replication initiator protein [Apis mellifera associated microvirus 38]|nr:replication initiator protein [Apis mellifera associated microvirus 38]